MVEEGKMWLRFLDFNTKEEVSLNPFAPQARDHNPNYDDYDYLQSDMHTVVTHNNPEYHTDKTKYSKKCHLNEIQYDS